jgi:hypothetical protein
MSYQLLCSRLDPVQGTGEGVEEVEEVEEVERDLKGIIARPMIPFNEQANSS